MQFKQKWTFFPLRTIGAPKIMTFFLRLLFSCFLRDCCNLLSIWSQFRHREPTKYLSFCENSAFLPSFLLLCRILSSVLSSAKHCPVQFQCNLKMQKKHPHYGPAWFPDPPQLLNAQLSKGLQNWNSFRENVNYARLPNIKVEFRKFETLITESESGANFAAKTEIGSIFLRIKVLRMYIMKLIFFSPYISM